MIIFDAEITGSSYISGTLSVTDMIYGTASYSTTASYALASAASTTSNTISLVTTSTLSAPNINYVYFPELTASLSADSTYIFTMVMRVAGTQNRTDYGAGFNISASSGVINHASLHTSFVRDSSGNTYGTAYVVGSGAALIDYNSAYIPHVSQDTPHVGNGIIITSSSCTVAFGMRSSTAASIDCVSGSVIVINKVK